jgi:tRNA (guanine-N7-)-methyltransferase
MDDDRARAFFGRRKGRPLRARQAGLFETLLPKLALDLTGSPPASLVRLFTSTLASLGPGTSTIQSDLAEPRREVRLEIGFGGGEHLLAQARANPEVGFIGCEPFINGMAKALAGIAEHGLGNIRLHFGDAVDLLAWLPPASLARIDLLYPDPWPKRRHWKRRFVQAERLALVADRLAPDGRFHFASDIADYVAWTLALAAGEPRLAWTAERADDWRRPWPGYVGTRYEAKAHREGRSSTYLVFRRV